MLVKDFAVAVDQLGVERGHLLLARLGIGRADLDGLAEGDEHGTAAQRFDPSGGAFGCMPGDPRHFFTTRNCRGLFRCPGGKQVACNSHGSKRALCECPAPPNASSAT